MDPISVTTTVITLATFIKDLVEIGQSIKHSIEKVRENRRRIRNLTDDVLRTLANLAGLIRGQEDTFQAQCALLSALGNLKAEMLYVLSICHKISPLERRVGIRALGSHIKVWMKREALEVKITRLKEHVNKCYIQFTAFSAARIEHTSAQVANTSLRVEQTLIGSVNNLEIQVKLRRLEGMMARMLLETQFGQNVLNRTVDIITSDPGHESLEFQYLSVQTKRLIDSFQQLLAGGNLVLHAPLWDASEPIQLVFLESTSLHVLHQILGAIVEINQRASVLPMDSMIDTVLDLGVHLGNIGLTSESIAWEHFNICLLHYLADRGYYATGALPHIAHALQELSLGYQQQLQYQCAVEASQQSLDLWHHLTQSVSEVDNQIGHLRALITHAQNLLETGQKMAALSTAQEAVALSRPILEQMIKTTGGLLFLTEQNELEAVQCSDAPFILARVLSSLDWHLESYEAFFEGFRAILNLPVSKQQPPYGPDIDSFLDQICKVVEGGRFSLVMVEDCAILFQNLARLYPKQFSSQFLWLLHAHAYFAQQNKLVASSLTIRFFLEPNSEHLPPGLDITKSLQINLDVHHNLIEDTVQAFCTTPSERTAFLIRNILLGHFDQAIAILQEVVEKLALDANTRIIDWVLYTLIGVVAFASNPSHRVALLHMLEITIKYFSTILVSTGSEWHHVLDSFLPVFHHLQRTGLLNEALGVYEQVIKYLESCACTDEIAVVTTQWRLNQGLILCDMTRFSDAIEIIQQTNWMDFEGMEGFSLSLYIIQVSILRRTGRNKEALQLLKKGVATSCQTCRADNVEVFHLQLNVLFVEYAATWRHIGHHERALKFAECAVTACQRNGDNEQKDQKKCVLIHSLTTLSNCLAAVQRNDKALAVAKEAVLLYTENVESDTIRTQELGGNAFHALSLHFTTFGKAKEALLNAKKATRLYRELVGLAPRHFPTLAISLRNLASILWDIGHRDKAITACEEAVSIMQKIVNLEVYFLPSLAEALNQLARYFTENCNVDAAASTIAEYTDVQRKFASLPLEPEFLFEEVEMEIESDNEDSMGSEDGWETASEAEDEYHDAPETPPSSEAVLAEASWLQPSAQTLNGSAQLNLCGIMGPETAILSAAVKPIFQEPGEIMMASIEATVLTGSHNESNKSPFTNILTKPLEIKLSSTPMDILWWILLGILSTIVWSQTT
ncbi:hypothetical protein B0H14DRAFT_3776768 [Mycena olivaceomarginata]|nr:hypothetical protein B0H14DRAFT_3776768 [Mycena olivaceomarginata]